MGAYAFFVTRAGEALPKFLGQCGYGGPVTTVDVIVN